MIRVDKEGEAKQIEGDDNTQESNKIRKKEPKGREGGSGNQYFVADRVDMNTLWCLIFYHWHWILRICIHEILFLNWYTCLCVHAIYIQSLSEVTPPLV